MSSRITLAARSRGAFRVEVAGTRPDEVTRVMLTGQGDEHGIDLPVGPYTANVTNIGTGDRQTIVFQVDESERLLGIGGDQSRSANWRSVSQKGETLKAWKIAGVEDPPFGVRGASSVPLMKSRTDRGWRRFAGTVKINDDLPTNLKVVRSKVWSKTPLLCAEFGTPDGGRACSFIPLFSGGTLIRWQDDGQVVEIAPQELKSAALVGSLSNSVRDELPKILQWAAGSDGAEVVQSIAHSRDDPWIATAAGLLLIGSARLKQNASPLSRLAARYPWMADLGVLAAWGRAVDTPDNEAACLDLLTQARRSGEVYYWQTCSIADRLLTALASSSGCSAVRTRGREEARRWRELRANAFKIGAFLGWAVQPQDVR